MGYGASLVWDTLVRDGASPGFLRMASTADKAATAAQRATKSVESASARMSAAGAKMTKSLTLPIVGIAAVSVDMAAKFQQSTNVLVTAAGETTANLKLVRKGILDIASSTGTKWQSVTDGLYQLEKAGYRGADALKVEKAAAQAAREEGANLATVTAAGTSIMASYHIPVSKAVSVMNQMKTAAGESKTTMEEFAGSLSTVLPLASANKVSFADIAGTLASLTQHGTSADEATQELAFSLRGLSAPNAVAQKEMAQLGISSVDVAKRLGDGPGGRGLAGTLKYLAGVVASKTGPSGKLVLSTLNASKIAAHDAQVEFNALAPSTQKVAKQFIDGKISSGEWRLAVKAMTPQQAALARQFAVTEDNARGFQQQLRTGVSVTQTSSDALKRMAGGANGLNVILQTTGESMKGTEERIKKIADAAKQAGTNVAGWKSTQKLFAVQLDIAKQKISVLAIQLGTKLIPVVMKIVDGVTKAVSWFDGLSKTDKKIIGWGLVVAAAFGPVTFILGRIISMSTGVVTALRGVGTAAGGLSARTALGLGAVGAVGGALGSTYVANRVNGSSKIGAAATVSGGFLGGAASGAAVGAIGGPAGALIGAGVGGIAGSVVGGINAFRHMGDAAKNAKKAATAALDAQRASADALYQSLLSVNGAYQDQTRGEVASQLNNSGALGIADKAGVDPAALISGVLGTSGQKGLIALNVQLENATAAGKISWKELAKVQSIIGTVGTAAATAEGKLELQARAMQGGVLTAAQLGTTYAKLKAAFAGTGTTLDATSAAGKRNREVLKENVNAINASVNAGLAQHKSVRDVATAYETQIGQLDANAHHLGLNDDAVAALVTSYGKLPKSVVTELKKRGVLPRDIQSIIDKYNTIPKVKTTDFRLIDYITGKLISIKAHLDAINDKTVYINTVNTVSGGGLNVQGGAGRQARAGGGPVRDGWFTVGERGWELGRKVGSKVDIFDNKTSQKMTGLSRLPGFANGTTSAQMSEEWTGISTFLGTAKATATAAAELRDAAAALRSSAKDWKVSSAEQARLSRDSTLLGKLASARDTISAKLGTPNSTAPTAYDRLDAAKSAYSDSYNTTRSAVTGSFDITTAGQNSWGVSTTTGILAAIQKAAANASKFAALVKRLAKEGLNKALIEQLTAAGPSALGAAQALAAATPKQLASINSSYKSLVNTGNSLGKTVADDFYKAGITSAENLVKGLLTKRSLLNKTISNLAIEMALSLENALGLATGKTTKAQYTAAEKKLEATFNIKGVTDPEAFAQAVARRLAKLVA